MLLRKLQPPNLGAQQSAPPTDVQPYIPYHNIIINFRQPLWLYQTVLHEAARPLREPHVHPSQPIPIHKGQVGYPLAPLVHACSMYVGPDCGLGSSLPGNAQLAEGIRSEGDIVPAFLQEIATGGYARSNADAAPVLYSNTFLWREKCVGIMSNC